MIPGVPHAPAGRGKRRVESSPHLAELLGLFSPCPAEGLLWIQTTKHQHFSSFSFLSFFFFFPNQRFGSAAPVGPARAAVCQAWSCQNHVPIHLMEESQRGDLQSLSAGNNSRMAGDKSHLHISRSRILFRWQLPVLPGDEMETCV